MTVLIRDLIHFEEVEEVIKLRKTGQEREIVAKYVISAGLRRNLLHMLDLLSGATHKSFNVVGNYGTGKSHFLAFVAALLEHPELRGEVQDAEVRSAAERLTRRYAVVKFELGAAQEVALRRIFFDQIHQQLLNSYDVDVPAIDLQATYDNQQAMTDIVKAIKATDPELGLVVIVDEISDFLKQKTPQDMTYDLNFLREMGQVSQDIDFLYIGAMQEHVFTNPKYVQHAENIARVAQRFVDITITKEDVAGVLTQRVVRKDKDQRLQLQDLLAEHKAYFTNVALDMERYIDLFPVHPYVIDVFERLPYFENRGIIGFAVRNVKEMLEAAAPAFITYDRIYDLINETHEIRNRPEVSKVIDVVAQLGPKVDLLDPRYRAEAQRIVKALAVLKMLGQQAANGATAQELANTLLITPPSKLVLEPDMARDNIARILKNIRDVTSGQFISYQNDYYCIDLTKTVDYDALIDRKVEAENSPEFVEGAFRRVVEADLGLEQGTALLPGLGVYDDTAPWPSRKSYRNGVLLVGKRGDGSNLTRGDYRFVVAGPVQDAQAPQMRQDELVLGLDLGDELVSLLRRGRAAELLSVEHRGDERKAFAERSRKAGETFLEQYRAALLARGYTLLAGRRAPLSDLHTTRPLGTLADMLDWVKGELLDAVFAERYPKYPKMRTLLTARNVEAEIGKAIQGLDKQTLFGMDQNSRGYLESVGALKGDAFDSAGSEACRLVLQRVQEHDKANKLTPLDEVVGELARPPWGLQRPLVCLLLAALLYNGEVVFVRSGGARVRAGEAAQHLRQGLGFFDQVAYLEGERDLDVKRLVALFNLLGLQPGLIKDKESRPEAVKALRARAEELKTALAEARTGLNTAAQSATDLPDIPWIVLQGLSGKAGELAPALGELAAVSRVSDLGQLKLEDERLSLLKERLQDLRTLGGFLQDWTDGKLGAGIRHLAQAADALPGLEPLATPAEVQTIVDLRRIAAESRAIYTDHEQLLREDQRRPLKGKVQQFRQAYDGLYYGLHERRVGKKAPWGQLDAMRQGERYQSLGRIKVLPFFSPSEFTTIALRLQALEQGKCGSFNAENLEAFAACPYCHFPAGQASAVDLSARLAAIQDDLDALWSKWEAQLLAEVEGLRAKLPLLSRPRRKLIEDLLAARRLPDRVPAELLDALLEIASDLQKVELRMGELSRYLLEQGSALSPSDLQGAIQAFTTELLSGHDARLVRIQIVPAEPPG